MGLQKAGGRHPHIYGQFLPLSDFPYPEELLKYPSCVLSMDPCTSSLTSHLTYISHHSFGLTMVCFGHRNMSYCERIPRFREKG
jgi:hypothetical protein